ASCLPSVTGAVHGRRRGGAVGVGVASRRPGGGGGTAGRGAGV
ncbi:MAG: hypothetical protein AVDCRST_MAG64-178, partial [uncultured Phycisphaerae bacterium]